MTEKTVSQIDAEIAALKRERDAASLDSSKSVQAALSAGKVATLSEDLKSLIADMSPESVARQCADRIISVIDGSKGLIAEEVARIERQVAESA